MTASIAENAWLYRDYFSPEVKWRERAEVPENCLYCRSAMSLLGKGYNAKHHDVWQYVEVCQVCGWWCFSQSYEIDHEDDPAFNKADHWIHCGYGYAVGTLKNMSPVDIREPIDDVSRYLVAKNEALGYISPKIAEDVVASAFKNVGYFVEQTPYIGDDGIDMYLLNGTGAREIAVQVKRWNKKVSVEPIRSFLGALMLAGITKGIMVLTGGYTKGAADAASKAKDYRLSHIDLKDGNWLLSTLKAGLNPRYSSIVDPNAPFRTLIEDPLLVQSWDRWRQWD